MTSSPRSTRPSVRPHRGGARSVAYETLNAVAERPVFLKTVLDELCVSFNVSGRDRALAFEIAAGVTRRRDTLDAVVNVHLRSPGGRIESRLRTVLRMGAYQLLFLATPPHAAVYEMVELARREQPRWARLVNGVLRSIERDLTGTAVGGPQKDAYPVCNLREGAADGPQLQIDYHGLHSAPFPSPEDDPAGYAATAFSLPGWLTARWQARYGDAELVRLAAWFATPGRMSLRVNPLRATPETVLQSLRDAGLTAFAGDRTGSVRLASHARVDQLPGFAEGHFSVQDESAQAVVDLLDPAPGQQVLDLCAAPGGKSTALGERMRNEGRITAADSDAVRVALIASAAERLGLTIVEPLVVRADSSDVPPGPFDRILLDVPCSNTGVLGKRPEARWRISETGIDELTRIQRGLLLAALDRLAVGGQLVYSTCSIEPEENADLVRSILNDRREFHLIREIHHQPGRPGDGGYQALIQLATA